jgi:3-hydroxyisobutyrate dehydrogenase-like beta-hydroxyacid dehydrogenase
MGGPMARNLIRAGHDVALWSHSGARRRHWRRRAELRARTPAEVAARSECVFLCVGNTEMSTEAILGAEGLGERERRGR